MIEKYGIDMHGFQNAVELLLPMIHVSRSPLTNAVYRGFGDDEKFIVKEKIQRSRK